MLVCDNLEQLIRSGVRRRCRNAKKMAPTNTSAARHSGQTHIQAKLCTMNPWWTQDFWKPNYVCSSFKHVKYGFQTDLLIKNDGWKHGLLDWFRFNAWCSLQLNFSQSLGSCFKELILIMFNGKSILRQCLFWLFWPVQTLLGHYGE